MFKIQEYLYQLLAVLTSAAGDKYTEVKPRIEEIVNDTEASLRQLAQDLLDGSITLADVPTFAEQEFYVLKTELLETAIIAESFAEETINAAVEKVTAIIKDILPKEQA